MNGFETLIVDACNDLDVSVRSYSGRGMFGKSCVGFVLNSEMSEFKFAMELMQSLHEWDGIAEIFLESFSNPSSDSLGRGTILYFPQCAWTESWQAAVDGESTDDDCHHSNDVV